MAISKVFLSELQAQWETLSQKSQWQVIEENTYSPPMTPHMCAHAYPLPKERRQPLKDDTYKTHKREGEGENFQTEN